MKYLVMVCLVLSGCAPVNGPTPDVSASGTLPEWLFAWNGHLVRPAEGTYGVYASPEIANDPAMANHLALTLQAGNSLTRGRIRFVPSSDPAAPVSFRIDPNSPHAAANLGWSELHVDGAYRCVKSTTGLQNREWFMSNVPLHELGHFLFGPGHSTAPEDIMNVNRDYSRMSFSPNEFSVWESSQRFAPGTTY